MEADDVNSDAANFKAQANAAFRSHQDWGPTDFTDPEYHSVVYKEKSFLSGVLDLWHRAPANETFFKGVTETGEYTKNS